MIRCLTNRNVLVASKFHEDGYRNGMKREIDGTLVLSFSGVQRLGLFGAEKFSQCFMWDTSVS